MAEALLDRLTNQLIADGRPWAEARSLAIALLKKRGDMQPDSTQLTPQGLARQALGAAGRAKDRAAVASGRDPGDYRYIPSSNTAVLKRR